MSGHTPVGAYLWTTDTLRPLESRIRDILDPRSTRANDPNDLWLVLRDPSYFQVGDIIKIERVRRWWQRGFLRVSTPKPELLRVRFTGGTFTVGVRGYAGSSWGDWRKGDRVTIVGVAL